MSWVKWLRIQWDRCAAWLAIALGALCLLLGWLGVSSTPFPAQQISYLVSGGLTGVFLLGLGAMLWLSADLRDQWAKLDRIEAGMQADREALNGTAPVRRRAGQRSDR
jgi:hypothetical protein